MTMTEYNREISRRLWRRRIKAAGELAGGILTMTLFAALVWAYIWMTPDQRSAEADWFDNEIQQMGGAK